MDEADQALEREENFRAGALALQRAKLSTGASRSHCLECKDAIPEKRRQAVAGCLRCIECQTEYDILRGVGRG